MEKNGLWSVCIVGCIIMVLYGLWRCLLFGIMVGNVMYYSINCIILQYYGYMLYYGFSILYIVLWRWYYSVYIMEVLIMVLIV